MTRNDTPAREHEQARSGFARALEELRPDPGDSFPCPYLPDRQARHLTVLPQPLRSGAYHALMDLNFRRLGDVFYRPDCAGCSECRVLRLPVAELRPNRSQRRCLERNRDVGISIGRPDPTREKWRLYQRYLAARHDGAMDGSWREFRRFLYASGVATREVLYHAAGRLLAVCVVDCEPLAWSAVYCYFEPGEARRGLGVFNVLALAEQCRRRGVPWLYLGYYIRGSRAMTYKAGFRPAEILGQDGVFRRLTGSAANPSLAPMAEVHSLMEALMMSEEAPRRFAPRHVIFEAGTGGEEMYVVRSGSVELRIGDVLLETVKPGGFFGEMSLIDPAPRSATAIAGDDCSLVAVRQEAFKTLVARVPSFSLEVMRVMARRLRHSNVS